MVAALANASLFKWYLINYLQNSAHNLETVNRNFQFNFRIFQLHDLTWQKKKRIIAENSNQTKCRWNMWCRWATEAGSLHSAAFLSDRLHNIPTRRRNGLRNRTWVPRSYWSIVHLLLPSPHAATQHTAYGIAASAAISRFNLITQQIPFRPLQKTEKNERGSLFIIILLGWWRWRQEEMAPFCRLGPLDNCNTALSVTVSLSENELG